MSENYLLIRPEPPMNPSEFAAATYESVRKRLLIRPGMDVIPSENNCYSVRERL